MSSEFLPCPFCGGAAFEPNATWFKTVRCTECSAQGPISAEDRRATWNRRSPAGDREQIAEMTAAVDGISSDYMTSEDHHPGWVLIPETKFRQLCEVEKALSQPRPEGEMREGSEHGEVVARLRASAKDFDRPPSIQSMANIRAIDAMNAAADIIEALVMENGVLRDGEAWAIRKLNEAEAERDTLRTQLERAEKALRPFVEATWTIQGGMAATMLITVDHIDTARSYFASLPTPGAT